MLRPHKTTTSIETRVGLQSRETVIPSPTADDPYEDEAYRLWRIKQQSK
jgi:hypothetical protein